MVVWKEIQHKDDDAGAGIDAISIVSLQGCGLLKFFHVLSMKSHVRLLEYILRMWNPKQQYFEVGAHILTVEVEYIYFLIRLSRQGEHISLMGPRGGDVMTQKMIDHHCFLGTQMYGKNIPIKEVMDFPL